MDTTHNPFEESAHFKKREEQSRKRVNHRAQARMRDADRWEEDRLRASGMVRMVDGADEEEDQVAACRCCGGGRCRARRARQPHPTRLGRSCART